MANAQRRCEGFLSQGGLIVPLGPLKSRFRGRFEELLNKLTIVHYQKIGPPKRAQMYKFAKYNGVECIQLPRTLMRTFLQSKILDNVEILFKPPKEILIQLNIDLYENQRILIDYLCNKVFTQERIRDGTSTAILNLRAGMGKTFVAGGIIAKLRMRTLYIVPKRPLMVQGVKDLRTCLYPDDGSAPPTIVGQYGKVKKRDASTRVENQGVTVIVINSAIDRDPAFFAGYSLVIMDEVHSYCSEQRREIFRKSATNVVLGMSATTEDRSDGFDPIAHKELAFDGIIRAEEVPGFTYENVEFTTEVSAIRYNGPTEFTRALCHESTGRIFTPFMNAQFLRDPHRMKLAIRELRILYDWRGEQGQQHCIYVFCEEREPLKTVFEELKKSFGDAVDAPELDDVGEFIGGIKDAKVTELKNNARILLTTFGYSGTGISIDKMTAILFLTSRKANMKQILARILRRGGDRTITRRIVDIIDNKTVIKYQYGSRSAAYEFYGMTVTETKIQYNEL